MGLTNNQQPTQLIEPHQNRGRRIVAVVVILIVITGLLISILIRPFGSAENQEGGNVISGLIWIGQIVVSFIALLASIVQLTGVSVRDFFSSREAKTNVEEFPFYVIQDFDKLLDYLFPDPKTPLISDRNIKYLPQIAAETDAALQHKGMVLIRGRSKTGKTREACELLRRWWYSGPTVLVARSHVGLYPPFKIPENLPVRNLVIIFDDIDRYLGDNAALKRLDETMKFFEGICHDRGELRAVATARQEEEFWEKLNFTKIQPPWNKFELVQLNPLSQERAQEVIHELSQMSEIAIEPSLVATLAEKNDGTFLNLALAFRGWLSQNIKVITAEDIRLFEGALKRTWRRRYEELATSHPDIKPVYAAIDFMQAHDLPLRPVLIKEIATEMGMVRKTLYILGWFDRLQNWADLSPIFNWYRDPKLRRKGWITISIAGIVVIYLLLYAFLRFTPGNTQFWFFNELSKNLDFQILCLLPLWILLIPFAFYSAMNILRNLSFHRMGKALELLLETEVPTRGGDLRPYENQFEGNGSTNNWDIQNYSGAIGELTFKSNVSQRITARYLYLAEQLRLNGEFSAASKLTILAQKMSPNHPAPLFMLGKIAIDEGNLQHAIGVLRASQGLYQRSSNISYAQERQALGHLLLGESQKAEQVAEKALKRMPSLLTARWILGLAQLQQGKFLAGQKNCKDAVLTNQPFPIEIQKYLETFGAAQEEWLKNFNVDISPFAREKSPKRRRTAGRGLALLFSITIISAIFIMSIPYVRSHLEQGESGVALTNVLTTIFPGSPILITQRGFAYYALGEYEQAIADTTEALRIDPELAVAYNNRGGAYSELGEYEQAIADITEALRIDPELALAYGNRGVAYYALGEYEQAIAEYTEALRIDPELASAYYNRGLAYTYLGEYEQAIADSNEALRIDPEFASAYNGRSLAYTYLGEYEQAIADSNEALRIDPEFASAYNGRGNAYYYLGEYEQAITDYTEALRIDPEYAFAYGNRGFSYYYLGEYEQAIADFNEALRLDPELASAYNGRGNAYSYLGEYEQAIADYTEALRLDPEYAFAYNGRGEAYIALGAYEQTIADLNEALRIDPEDAAAYYNRGLAYQALGKQTEAEADFQKYYELSGLQP